MNDWISIGISFVALAVSVTTAWLTLFRRGELRMTQPTVIFFGPDGGSRSGRQPQLKVFLRTLLYSTSRRGQTVESLHINLQRGESKQNFSIWVYGDQHLARGSGLFVPAEGIACNHHFLLPSDGTNFRLLEGDYMLRIYAKRVDVSTAKEFMAVRLRISESHAKALEGENVGIYFDWGPDQQAYHPHIEKVPPKPMSALLHEERS
ncbi:hypothetical protein HUU05_15065 [candidate division KSB1 bacterium]|nr:hypothetical protein [candidate division KSB1 bacterium]